MPVEEEKGSNDEDDDIKDEGEDKRVLGKRGREEKSVNRTGRTDKKALLKSKSAPKVASKSAPKEVAQKFRRGSRDGATVQSSKKSRPGSKESRLKKLGKWTDGGKQDKGKGGQDKSKGKGGKRVGTPTFKRQKK